MKLHLVISGLLALLVAASGYATTLKLDPDIDLLVLDGRKISGSLLKGAEGLELNSGEHQFLFQVEKTLQPVHRATTKHYISVPMIVTFTAHTQSVTIQLPPLLTPGEGHDFDKIADFRLLDEHGGEIISKRDRLVGRYYNTDVEKAMMAYNRNGEIASVPRFALQSHAATEIPSSVDFVLSDTATERLLQLWFHQVDDATRQRFISWIKALRAT